MSDWRQVVRLSDLARGPVGVTLAPDAEVRAQIARRRIPLSSKTGSLPKASFPCFPMGREGFSLSSTISASRRKTSLCRNGYFLP